MRKWEVPLRAGEASGMLRQGLKPSSRVSTPSGKTLPLGSLFSPPVPGRKVVLLGDTCDSGAIEGFTIPLLQECICAVTFRTFTMLQ